MKLLKKSLAVILAFALIFSTMSVAAHADEDKKVSFAAKFLRLNSEGQWVETSKAKPGESLKLQIYIGTNYNAGSIDLMTAFDKNYFTLYDEEAPGATSILWDSTDYPDNVKKNKDIRRLSSVSAVWFKDSYDNSFVADLIDNGDMPIEVLDTTDFITSSVIFTSKYDATPMDIGQWMVEFGPFVVNNNEYVKDSTHTGVAGIPSEYLMAPETTDADPKLGINVPEDVEGEVIAMIDWEKPAVVDKDQRAQVSVFSNVILNGNGGTFGSDATKTLSSIIGESVTGITVPTYKKHTFKGWSTVQGGTTTLTDGELADLKYDYTDINLYAVWEDAPAGQVSYNLVTTVQNADGSYANPTSETLSGLDGSTVTPPAPAEGFEIEGTPSLVLDSEAAEIQTLNVTVNRKKYNVTYYKSNGTDVAQKFEEVLYGAAIPECTSYTGEAGKNLEWECQTEGSPFATMPAKDVTFKAKLTDIIYSYIFNAVDSANTLSGTFTGGSTTKVVEYKYNDEPSDPKNDIIPPEGYEFDTWSKAIPGKVTEDISDFEARYKPINYTATYTVSGAPQGTTVNPPAKAENLHIGNKITLPAIPSFSQEGYSIDGWYVNGVKADKVAAGSEFVMPADDVEFVAAITKNSHKIIFDVNGGNAINPIDAEYGEAVDTLPTPTINDSEYTFDGWVDTDNNNAPVEKIESMPDKDVHLKATWKQKEYTVTYEYDGEVPAGAPAVPTDSTGYHNGANVTVKPNPTFTGWTFSGWKLNGSVVTSFDMGKANVTLKGSWEKNGHKIYFDTDGGNTIDPIDVKFGEDAGTLPTPTKDDYEFLGWVDTDNDNAPVEKIASMPDKDVHLKATWKQNEYTVTYEYDGAVPAGAPAVPTDSATYHNGENVTVKPNPTFTGWTFSGWKLNGSVVTSFDMVKANVTLKGSWSKNSHKIYFDTDQGDVIAPMDVEYGEAVNTLPTPTKDDYGFQGWVDTDNDNAPVEKITSMPDKDVHLKATWKQNEYTVTYEYDGEVPAGAPAVPTDSATYHNGENVTVKPNPTFSGWTFSGWKLNGSVVTSFDMGKSDVTLKGSWKKNGGYVNYYLAKDQYGNPVGEPIATEWVDEGSKPTGTAPQTTTGFTFKGWVDKDGNPLTESMPNENVNAFAVIELNKYNVVYKDADSTPIKTYENVGYGTEVPVPSDPTPPATATPDLTENIFTGWKNVRTGTIGVPEYMPDNELEFIATYQERRIGEDHTVTYMANGKTFKSYIVHYGDPVPVPDEIPTKFLAKFVGWTPENPGTMPNEDLVFTAQFESDTNIDIDVDEQTVIIGGAVVAGAAIAAALAVNTAIITSIAVVGGVIVIAGVTHVIKNTYTVTYKVDGEVYRTFKVLAGLKVPTPKNPSKDGAEFAGWDEAIPDKMPAHDITFNATWGNENVVNPDTGSSAAGISAFAALSTAAAAAYVFGRKKKEDEE